MRLGAIAFVLFFGITFQLSCQEQPDVEQITAERLEALIQDDEAISLLDVRTPEELAETGKIGEATVIDFHSDSFEQDVLELDREKTWVIYCGSGYRSQQAAEHMLENGFEKVYNLEGGITAWQVKGE